MLVHKYIIKTMTMFKESQTYDIQKVDTIEIGYEFNNLIQLSLLKYYIIFIASEQPCDQVKLC